MSEMSKLPAICVELRLQAADGVPVVNSRDVAELFERPHKDVLASIRALEIGEDVRRSWFRATTTPDSYGREQPSFDLTEQGLMLLVMGWNGERAMQLKVRYIQAFDAMRATLKAGASVNTSDLQMAIREIVAPLAVRFDYQDRAIERVEARQDAMAADIADIKAKLKSGRQHLKIATRLEHVAAVGEMGGRCPCCGLAEIVHDGEKSRFAEFDHFYANGRASVDNTWLICKPCHAELTNERVPRDQRETEFKAYQQRRRRLPGRQITLFG